ncbi:hypothetical protein VE01_06152 [Pseudogymnoascus verrucosus]|uniref:Protein SQS1 n=1 Tax=Pseudogymnoascus verrucosus TaxID=342668 RepID=A0A1B8GFQ5_9PEZI|nr:uncharacterized protein VE01_06152 [Pseudogymnoascus verrucosus]OBT94657.1 hypothetical protein VE01_06152 [Pseudogymnoascus verrucosus]
MVRSKKGPRGGGAGKSNGRGQGRRGRGGGRGGGGGDGGRRHVEDDDGADFIPFSGASTPASYPQGFSLQAEALNTQRHEPSRLSNLRLWDAKVSFVSASILPSPETPGPETAMECMSLNESDNDLGMGGVMDSSEQAGNIPEADDEEGSHESKEKDAQDEFIIDTEGNQSIETNLPPPQIRSSSPTPSNSSEEVILFRGRDNNGQFFGSLPSTKPKPSKTSSLRTTINDDVTIYTENKQSAVESSLATDVLHLSGDRSQVKGKGKGKEKGHLPDTPSTNHVDFQNKLSDSLDTPPLTSRKSRHGSGRNREIRSVEDEMMNDYITNLEEQGLDVLGHGNGRELGDNDNDIFQRRDSSPDSDMELLEEHLDPSDFLDQDTLEILDEISGPIDAVLSRRDAKSGLQYLVAWSEHMSDKSGWVPASAAALVTPQALDLIGKFDANEKLVTESLDGDADDSDSADDDLTESTDSEDDDMDLIQRQFDNLNDEKIARLLAKQFEFGFDSSELALFDGLNEPSGGSSSTARNRKREQFQRREKVSRTPQSGFPSATRLADAYDGFDVMDFERPSLKKKPKGRKGRLPFDVSDPELEASMQSAWENDRVKKKQRKEDREHRRALGVLGIHPDKPDLSMKYKEGMGIMAIKEEIRLFLIGKNTTLALPPMDKKDRIVVHEIANAFNLKSKSVGAERKRFPVLYRTHRTSAYNENVFTSVERRISRRFFPRMDVKGKNPMAKTSSGFRGTAGGYKDGDVVGGSAPELGVENRGRAMMEKMGWSSGTALGALNNKGILQPVSHVVKTTKAGLG